MRNTYVNILYSSPRPYLTLIPTLGAPLATACKAYSICTSLPLGLKVVREKLYLSDAISYVLELCLKIKCLLIIYKQLNCCRYEDKKQAITIPVN